jgi:LSD1 subclass zinc finger protein
MIPCKNGCGTLVEYTRGSTKMLCPNCWLVTRAIRRKSAAKARAESLEYKPRGVQVSKVRPNHVKGLLNTDTWYISCDLAYIDAVRKHYPNGKFTDQKLWGPPR